VAADGGYYSGKNLKYADTEGIDLYLPVTRNGRVPDERFHRDEFEYDGKSDSFRCPEGQSLRYLKSRTRKGVTSRIYTGSASTCDRCKSRSQCTKKRVRQLQISENLVYERKMTAKLESEYGQFIYGQRKHLVEPVFGNIKFNLGFARYTLRTLNKVRGEFMLFCITHNLKKLAKHLSGLFRLIFAKFRLFMLYFLQLQRSLEHKSTFIEYQL